MDDRALMPPPPLPPPLPPQPPQPQPPEDLEQFYAEAAMVITLFLVASEAGTDPYVYDLLTLDALSYVYTIEDAHEEFNL